MTVVVDWVQAHLGFLPPQVLVVIVSMLPVIELRGGIPLARLLMLPLWQAIVFSAIGNILPIPFILLFVEKVFDWLRPTKLFGPLVEKLEKRALSKSDGIKHQEGRVLGPCALRRDPASGDRRLDRLACGLAPQDRYQEGLAGDPSRDCDRLDDHVADFVWRVCNVNRNADDIGRQLYELFCFHPAPYAAEKQSESATGWESPIFLRGIHPDGMNREMCEKGLSH